MLTWLSTRLRDIRIAVAYPRYEAAERDAHFDAAKRRFSTESFETEAKARMGEPCRVAEERFAPLIMDRQATLARLHELLDGNREKIRLFERVYRVELNDLYSERNELVETREAVHVEKAEAHAAFDDAQSSIDRWYAKSQGTWFGNGGKKLPQHSPWGQSMADLDGYKIDRDRAGRAIGECRAQLEQLSDEINDLRGRIKEVKADRDRMYALKRSGYRPSELRAECARTESSIEVQTAQLSHLIAAKEDFLNAESHRTGAAELEIEIDRIRKAREEWIASFDHEEARAERRARHRQAWLDAHQRRS